MLKSFFRFLFIIAVTTIVFVYAHVRTITQNNLIIAIIIGAIMGFILFIAYNLLFPVQRNQVKKANARQTNNFDYRDKHDHHRNERNSHNLASRDTDKIEIPKQ